MQTQSAESKSLLSGAPPGSYERDVGGAHSVPLHSTKPGQRFEFTESYARFVAPSIGGMLTAGRRILADEAEAWDAVQDVLIGLWRRDELPRKPRSWLIRAVVLRSLHLARSKDRRRRHENRACERRPEADHRNDPAVRIECEEFMVVVDETLQTISPDSRAVVVLRIDSEMDYAAIADSLHIPIGTVRSRLSRTRRAFRKALSDNSFLPSE
jgi:RNA polymerase sigma-70 factor (ECF subfamily)